MLPEIHRLLEAQPGLGPQKCADEGGMDEEWDRLPNGAPVRETELGDGTKDFALFTESHLVVVNSPYFTNRHQLWWGKDEWTLSRSSYQPPTSHLRSSTGNNQWENSVLKRPISAKRLVRQSPTARADVIKTNRRVSAQNSSPASFTSISFGGGALKPCIC